MKSNTLLFLIFIGTIISCEKKDSNLKTLKGESGISYSESLSKWTELKSKNGNSYVYRITFTSWTGFSAVTELKVMDGTVTSRIYKEFSTNETNGQRELIDSYSETSVDLGNHEKGAKPQTIDELYNTCASEYLIVDEKNNTLFFDTDLNGLMKMCGFVPNGCVDDCYRGVKINSFSWIE